VKKTPTQNGQNVQVFSPLPPKALKQEKKARDHRQAIRFADPIPKKGGGLIVEKGGGGMVKTVPSVTSNGCSRGIKDSDDISNRERIPNLNRQQKRSSEIQQQRIIGANFLPRGETARTYTKAKYSHSAFKIIKKVTKKSRRELIITTVPAGTAAKKNTKSWLEASMVHKPNWQENQHERNNKRSKWCRGR